MPVTAILCGTVAASDAPETARAHLYFAGQSLLEYQARQAHDAGAQQVIALVDAVTPSLSRTVDRLTTDGIRIRLMRDMPTLMREMPREADILIFTDGAIAEQRFVQALVEAPGNAVLVTEDTGATPHLERIDGIHRWCGIALISNATVAGTLDLIGDWDLSLTLLRAAVQGDARRIAVPTDDVLEGRAAIVDRQATADLVANVLMSRRRPEGNNRVGAEHYLLGGLARLAAGRCTRLQMPPLQVRLTAIALCIFALLTLYPGWRLVGLALLLLAILCDMAADQMNQIARRKDADRRMGAVSLAAIMLAMIGVAWGAIGWANAVFLAMLAALVQLYASQREGRVPLKWVHVSPGTALLVLGVGVAAGLPAAAATAAIIFAIGGVGWLLLGAGD